MGKARSFSTSDDEAVLQSQSDRENYAVAAQQNAQNLGSVHFSDNSGYGNFKQSGRDQRNASLEGALFRGNLGFNLQTAVLDVGTETLDILEDGSSNPLNVISVDKIVTLSAGLTGNLTTILGAQRPGQRLLLYGIQGNTITIKNTASATDNTILTPDGADFTLTDTNVALLVFDITTIKWRVLSGGGSGGGGLTDPIILNENDLGTIGFLNQIIDWSTNNFYRAILNGDVAITMSNLPVAGKWEQVIVEFKQDGSGGHAVTFLDTFANGVVPIINPGADTVTTVVFYAYNNGTSTIMAFDVLSNFGPVVGPEYLHASRLNFQGPTLPVGDHIEWETVLANNGLTVTTGNGNQLDGIISGFRAGHIYECECFAAFQTLSGIIDPDMSFQFFDVVNAVLIGSHGNGLGLPTVTKDTAQPSARAIFLPSADTDTLRVDFTFNNNLAENLMFGSDGAQNAPQTYVIIKDITGLLGGAGTIIMFPPVLISDVLTITNPAPALNLDVGTRQHFVIELDKNIVITFINVPPNIDTSEQVVLEFIQDITGGRTVGYTDSIDPSVPVISLVSGARDVVTGFIRRENAGTYVFNLYLVGN